MVDEVLALFGDKMSTFLDCNLGVGGHAKAILQNHPELRLLIGIDKDQSALKLAKQNLGAFEAKVKYVHGDFNALDQHLKIVGIKEVDGVLFDLGVSSMQLDEEKRGFSFRFNSPLDMRMDQTDPLCAKDIVNTWTEKELGELFKNGDVRNFQAIAKRLVQFRRKQPILTTFDLIHCLEGLLIKTRKHNSATLVFQALRLAVNKEMKHLQEALPKALSMLKKGGICVVISFHSLEDRIVKNFIRENSAKLIEGQKLIPKVCNLTKKPLTPKEETKINKRARSAKLRAFRKV